MACISPPEPTDVSLLTVLDGEGEAEVGQHLEACPHCRERADQLALLNGALQSSLYRLDCPMSDELGDYHLKLLSRAHRREITNHLKDCPHCSEEIEQLTQFLETTREDIGITKRDSIQKVVANLISPKAAIAAAGIRGAEEGVRVYEADELQISVLSTPDELRPDRIKITGLVIGPGGHNWNAELRREAEVVATAGVDDHGNFALLDLKSGAYSLVLVGPEVDVVIDLLEI